MQLYHFPTSPFARRVRLALWHKGLVVELRDARASDQHMADVRRLNPLHTVPVLVDGDVVLGDSNAILHYLDRKVPTPPLWPAGVDGADGLALSATVDSTIGILVDLGLRYATLHDHARFSEVRAEYVGRAQRGLDTLAQKASARVAEGAIYFCGDHWTAADMSVVTMVQWLEGLPGRAKVFPGARKILDLGWSVPPALSSFVARHRGRDDVASLG